jgi:hypothetical protein
VRSSWVRLGSVVLVSVLPACKGSLQVEAGANVDVQSGKHAEVDEPPDHDNLAFASGAAQEAAPRRQAALLGARHDLRLKAGVTGTTCSCLVARLGQARDPEFVWQGEPPATDPNTQLTLAFSSEGVTCEGEPQGSLGASYWGFRKEGDDVVVLVEAARFGRPITSGAVIPRPAAAGSVYLKPLSPELPYGKPASGSGNEARCKLGNPGRPSAAR